MNLLGVLLAAANGAGIGGALWVAIGHFSGYEIGFVAWGVGLAAGIGALSGAHGKGSAQGGVIAAVLALLSIVIAKYIIIELAVNKGVAELQAAFTTEPGAPVARVSAAAETPASGQLAPAGDRLLDDVLAFLADTN